MKFKEDTPMRRTLVLSLLVALALAAPAAALEVGQKAPDFTLPGSQGQPVKRPVVLYTFIQAFTNT
jgi:hypothetical protein